MNRQSEFFQAVASRNIVRVRVAAIVISGDKVLVQRPTDEPDSCYAFIGGEYEVGDSFETRLRKEFEEETTAKVLNWRYLFVVENSFVIEETTVQNLEHYLEVTLDRDDIQSREAHLAQHWLSLAELQNYDVRPTIVRDAIISGTFREIRHLTCLQT